jgi:hypothetical protein
MNLLHLKFLLITLLIILIKFDSRAQTSQVILDETFSYQSENFQWKVTKSDNLFEFKISLDGKPDSNYTFNIKPLKVELFKNGFRNALKSLNRGPAEGNEFNDRAASLFLRIYLYENTVEESTIIAGTLNVNETITVYDNAKDAASASKEKVKYLSTKPTENESKINQHLDSIEKFKNEIKDYYKKISADSTKLTELGLEIEKNKIYLDTNNTKRKILLLKIEPFKETLNALESKKMSLDNDINNTRNLKEKDTDSLKSINKDEFGVSKKSEFEKSIKFREGKINLLIQDFQIVNNQIDSLYKLANFNLTELKDLESENNKFNNEIKINTDKQEEVKSSMQVSNKHIELLNQKQLKVIHEIKELQKATILKVKDIQMEVQDGAIENIYVSCIDTVTNREIYFKNNYPISFSRLIDYRSPSNIILFLNTNYNNIDGYDFCIVLSDLIRYKPYLWPDSRNYSPQNKVHVLVPPLKDFKLYKEETTKILKAKVFTDVVGLKGNQPNGLIQTEVSKKILISTRRFRRILPFKVNERKFNSGYLTFIEPEIAISKIEDNNFSIPARNKFYLINNSLDSRKYLSTLEIHQYQNFKAGVTTNLMLTNITNWSSTIFLNVKINFGRTAVSDSVRIYNNNIITTTGGINDFTLNTIQFIPELIWQIKPDPRYGVSLGSSLNYMFTRHPEIIEVGNLRKYEVENENTNNNYLCSFFMLAHLKTGLSFNDEERTGESKGEFFFKMAYNFVDTDHEQNFFQAQLGYSFYLLKKN